MIPASQRAEGRSKMQSATPSKIGQKLYLKQGSSQKQDKVLSSDGVLVSLAQLFSFQRFIQQSQPS